MARILVAGPLTTPQDREVVGVIQDAVRALGHEVPPGTAATTALVESCDALVVLLDHVDAATLALAGYAKASRRPVYALHAGPGPTLTGIVDDQATVETWELGAVRAALQPWLQRVRVFAGTLVRDAVPKILESEGKTLAFRNVAPDDYPPVLKRKIVETAKRLEDADFGLEQEEIADLLELLETLINLRKYDRESLRSIKEGKWRKRGGYERGFLLQEEPASSR